MPPHIKKVLTLGTVLLISSLSLLANTPNLIRGVPAAGCYCKCAESHSRTGCMKICDSKRFAARWCAKPHMQIPAETPDAGPRYPHPSHAAEHAKL
jgi:hypothetical protein